MQILRVGTTTVIVSKLKTRLGHTHWKWHGVLLSTIKATQRSRTQEERKIRKKGRSQGGRAKGGEGRSQGKEREGGIGGKGVVKEPSLLGSFRPGLPAPPNPETPNPRLPGGPGSSCMRRGRWRIGIVYTSLLDLCVSSLCRDHANLLCIIQMLTDDPRRGRWRMGILTCACAWDADQGARSSCLNLYSVGGGVKNQARVLSTWDSLRSMSKQILRRRIPFGR